MRECVSVYLCLWGWLGEAEAGSRIHLRWCVSRGEVIDYISMQPLEMTSSSRQQTAGSWRLCWGESQGLSQVWRFWPTSALSLSLSFTLSLSFLSIFPDIFLPFLSWFTFSLSKAINWISFFSSPSCRRLSVNTVTRGYIFICSVTFFGVEAEDNKTQTYIKYQQSHLISTDSCTVAVLIVSSLSTPSVDPDPPSGMLWYCRGDVSIFTFIFYLFILLLRDGTVV